MLRRIANRTATACLALVLAACSTLQSTPSSTTRSIPSPTPPSPVAGSSVPREKVPAASVLPRVERNDRTDETEQVVALIAYSRWLAAARVDEQRREFSSVNQAFARDPGAYARVKLALLLSVPGSGFTDEVRAVTLLEPLAGGATGTTAASTAPLRDFAFLLHAQLGERVREQKRSAQLREQLDALKAIERSLIERGRPQRK